MKQERILRGGPHQSLVGVHTQPARPTPAAPTFVLLNAGLLHRVGPGRIYVNLARALAATGVACVRFDVSGLGDSGFRADNLPYHQSRIIDTQAIMDLVQADFGAERFVVLGICSGADHAFRVACADRRVVGGVFVDAYTYPTRKSAPYYYGRRLFRPASWLNVITGKHPLWRLLAKSARQRAAEVTVTPPPEFVVDTPPRNEVENHMRTLLANRANLFFLYTASVAPAYTYSSQFYDMFRSVPKNENLRAEYWPDVDHLFNQVPHQRRFVGTVCEWSVRQWPPA